MEQAAHFISGIPTWAHLLGAAGYETALMGKMHFVGSDHRHGFEKRPLGEFLARHPGVPALFDLEEDPDEKIDLAQEERCKPVREELMQKARFQWDPEWAAREAAVADEDYRVLASWGKVVQPRCAETLEVTLLSWKQTSSSSRKTRDGAAKDCLALRTPAPGAGARFRRSCSRSRGR